MENQWVQWVPLFGFGSVLTILMAIFGVGIGLWLNATIAYRNINDKIERMGSRLQSRLGSTIGGRESKLKSETGGLESRLGGRIDKLGGEVGELSTDVSVIKVDLAVAKTDLNWIRNQLGGPAG